MKKLIWSIASLMFFLSASFVLATPNTRTYVGRYEENDIVVDEEVEEEFVADEFQVAKEEEVVKEEENIKKQEDGFEAETLELSKEEKFWEEQTTLDNPIKHITATHNVSGELEDSSKKEHSGEMTSIQEPEKKIYIIPHDHLPLGGEYKMKE